MAATDKNYRKQHTLDIVFAASCVLMLLSILWMLYDDYSRPFKEVQRKFRDVETGIFENAMLEKFPDDLSEFKALEKQVDEARKAKKDEEANLKDHLAAFLKSHPQESNAYADNPERWVKAKLVTKTNLQTTYQDFKSKIDSKTSFYNEDMEKAGAETDEKLRKAHVNRANQLAAEIITLTDNLNKTRRQIDEIDSGLATVQGDLKKADDRLSKAEDDLKKLTADFDRLAKTTALKKWKSGDWIRALPILDGFASPVKPNQITLKALTIDYGGFADVTRFDRCTTCHLGIDRFNFDKASLRLLANEDKEHAAQLQKKLDNARKFLLDRQKKLEANDQDLGFDPNDLPKTITTMKLSPAEVTQYCAHPRLELFVDANSKHPMEKFGCTICHAGQGSATDFTLAVHTPGDMKQKEEWQKEHDWAPTHDWEFPMYSSRFVESSCLKCHYQVTDLITHGSREEAPKLLRGYNLVKENGCFGCHEIAGIKSGRAIGPDLRLEPNPPLDSLTPEERSRALSDPLNPPGTMRKVGPSLYRISEKTNEKWARSWLNNPRGFRADTKMPHFYNVSNNNKDSLPKDQQEFPDAEIHSIISYLFQASEDYLNGQDDYRKGLVAKKKKIEEELRRQEPPLAEVEKKKLTKDLEDVEERYKYVKEPPTPIAKGLVDEFDKPVELPAAPKDAEEAQHRARGRHLFSEKGCLACHSHQGTTKAAPDTPALNSEATFGPNLSRLADKIAPEGGKDKRRWLVQWILNPMVHSPRTRMPNTHLTPAEAADITDWLLSQPADDRLAVRYPEVADWKDADIAEPSIEALSQLAKVYLAKAPGMTLAEADDILKDQKGMTADRAKSLAADADERKLEGELNAKKLKWYIGKKSAGRMGCYACHNVPGFESAKPIGTALNDWGAKDPNRLAFEEGDVWVKEHNNIVKERDSAAWKEKDGKAPYEEYFYQALEHHQRDGFLHQKLSEPRSFDYHRLRTWDDRLRMPRFRFAHLPKRSDDESDEDYQAKIDKEEDEAREAVMTFILGLVADPIPPAYVNDPKGDRLHEVKGRQVLDKYNCAGCHQMRPGVTDYKLDKDALELLHKSFDKAATSLLADHRFPDDYAWAGQDPPAKDLLRIYGVNPTAGKDDDGTDILRMRLAHALRIPGDNGARDLPAGYEVKLLPENLRAPSATWGGAFPDLLSPYFQKIDNRLRGSDGKARSSLPPPLEHEGERTQPAWLYGFLKKPEPVRPTTWMALRMPKFNFSDDEATQIVNYFAAVDRLENPGVGLSAPYLTIKQRDDSYWIDRDRAYASTIGKAKLVYWTTAYLTGLKDKLKAADEERKNAKGDDLPKAQKKYDDLEKKAKTVEELLSKLEKVESVKNEDFPELRRDIVETRPYAGDAYKLLLNPKLCLECHQIGQLPVKLAQGPPLDLAADRLRPEWTQRWMANPERLFTYSPNMPSNFAKNADNFREFFDGLPLEQATALRDIMMNLAKVAELPENRKTYEAAGGK